MPQRFRQSENPPESSRPAASPDAASWPVVIEGGRPFYRVPLPPDRDEPLVELTVPRQIVQRYEVQGVFARGGGGVIFAGFDLLTLNRVLIKALAGYHVHRFGDRLDPPHLAGELRRVRHRLQTERRILVQLRNAGCNGVPNPNDYAFDQNPALRGPYRGPGGRTWQFEDTELIGSEPFLIMEYIPGQTLDDWLVDQRGQAMDPRRAVRIIRQIVQILHLLHQPVQVKGMAWQRIYQDLKPSNVMLGTYDRVTLLDLGGCQLSVDGQPVLEGACTSGFCPPECERLTDLLDARADVYCVGSTLYALVTGQDPRDIIEGSSSGHARAVRIIDRVDSMVPPGMLREFLRRCLAWDPSGRFPDLAAVDAELKRLEQL